MTTIRLLACCALAALGAALASPGRAEDDPAAGVQLLADITLIDGQCRNVEVDFGRAFQAASELGTNPAAVMPTGPERAAFEAATRARSASTPSDELCEGIARGYAERVPGVIRFR